MSEEALKLSDSAVARIKQIIANKSNPELKLRVYVMGGGCSGFQYGFDLEQQPAEDDMEIDENGVTLLVDAMSYQYLSGAEVDFKDDLMGARFIVNNPNATATCGCGSSFSI